MPNCLSASFRYQTYPRFTCISRAVKNLWGIGKVAKEPSLPSATSTRPLAFSGIIISCLTTPPNWYCCGLLLVSRQVSRGNMSVEKPFRPASNL